MDNKQKQQENEDNVGLAEGHRFVGEEVPEKRKRRSSAFSVMHCWECAKTIFR